MKLKAKFDVAARRNETVPISPAVKILFGVIALKVIGLVLYVCYSFQQTQTYDENVEERILSRNTMQALIRQYAQNSRTMYNMIILFMILVRSIVFGYHLFHPGVAHHKDQKGDEVVQAANLLMMQRNLDTAENYKDELKDVKERETVERGLWQDLTTEKPRITRLQMDLTREQSEKSTLKSALQTEQTQTSAEQT